MLKLERLTRNEWRFQADWPPSAEARFDQALDLMEAGKLDLAEDRLREVLMVYPDHIDVWHHLGLILENCRDDLLSYACTREAVRLGLDAIPKDFSWLTGRMEWSFLENRPFLRAYHKLGLYLMEHGGASEALEPFTRLLAVSPNDNLGVRYLLMECHLALEDWEAAMHLADRYQDDISPAIIYSKVVALLGLDREAEAVECLQEAVRCHPKVANELLKSRHMRPKSAFAGCITVGGEDEAFSYWERNKVHWAKDTAAYGLLHQLKGGKKS
ncbi:tetratricopeptide repeat protein [Burkholderia ubonensis]|uniref:tetratricopeptide repeat protein n=1 Tax=Burkholderia ubonensis TaxID=101571 RepID=UPI002AB06C09|nr:tetratricopeptide repeat protein [Burkholderia ubonensis]